jgi:hypothetical protein
MLPIRFKLVLRLGVRFVSRWHKFAYFRLHTLLQQWNSSHGYWMCCAFRNGMTAFFSVLRRPRLSPRAHSFPQILCYQILTRNHTWNYIIGTQIRETKENELLLWPDFPQLVFIFKFFSHYCFWGKCTYFLNTPRVRVQKWAGAKWNA